MADIELLILYFSPLEPVDCRDDFKGCVTGGIIFEILIVYLIFSI